MWKDQWERILFRLFDGPFWPSCFQSFWRLSWVSPLVSFLQVLDKRADSGRIDLLLILYDDAEDLGPVGVVPKAFLNGSPELERDGCEHIIYDLREVVAVKVADREKMSSSITEPCSCKGLDPLRTPPPY